MQRRPQSYVGIGHETIGSDILAFLKAVHAPDLVLTPELNARLKQVKPDEWYPIQLLLDLLAQLQAKLGDMGLRSMGWSIFQGSHAQAVKANAKSARDIVYGIDEMYHRANRGSRIGGWKVLEFSPGLARLEKTTPHTCQVEEGILEEGLRAVGVSANVSQTRCFAKGDSACEFVITSKVTDARWTG